MKSCCQSDFNKSKYCSHFSVKVLFMEFPEIIISKNISSTLKSTSFFNEPILTSWVIDFEVYYRERMKIRTFAV